MNFCLVGTNKSEIIKNYRIENNSLIVTYLDGVDDMVPYNEHNEQLIIERMMQQAKERDNNKEVEKILNSNQNRIDTFRNINSALGMSVGAYGICTSETPKNLLFVLYTIFFMNSFIYNNHKRKTKFTKEELEEIKKYHIFLKMKQVEGININTLDSYSLEEITKLKEKQKMLERTNTAK